MPRQKRADEAGFIYHALNRGNGRQAIFHKPGDYEAFLRVLGEGLERYPVELFSFMLMPNHWHIVLRPSENRQMGRLLRWVTATHTQRYHAHHFMNIIIVEQALIVPFAQAVLQVRKRRRAASR